MSHGNALGLRRLPIYLVLDCSGSMAGEPIAALEVGLKALLGDLRNDPQALETVWLRGVPLAHPPESVVPLTEITASHAPELSPQGTPALGEALDLLAGRIRAEVRLTRPDRK